MNGPHRLYAIVAVLFITALVTPAVQAEAKPLKPTAEWRGSVEDLTLQTAAPASGALTSQKAFADLWKAWKPDDKLPEVDFTKELVLVATTRGSRLSLSAALDEQGNLQPRGISTRDLRPGFRFHLIAVSREGVKTINNKPLPKD